MGLFDGIKAMATVTKDIIQSGKATYEACEVMDALITRANNLGDISVESRNAIKVVETAKATEDDNQQDKIQEAQVKALEAFQNDAKLSVDFKVECKEAIAAYKEVSNGIYDKLGNTLSKFAESEEELNAIKNVINEEKNSSSR